MNENYVSGTQADGEECLTYFLDNFIMATNKEGIDIAPLFDCKLASKLKCPECNYESEMNVPEKLITIPIKNFNNYNDAMNSFLSDEVLDDNNKWECETCKKKVSAIKKLIIRSTPKYLFLALKRFEYEYIKERNQIKTTKINSDIFMPDTILINNVNYKMKGSIFHMGGLNGGHYVYYHKINNQWKLFNDSTVSDHSNDPDIINKGYVYLYERE